MADLIDDVLDFARLGGTLRATEVDLEFVLGEVLDDLSPELVDVELHITRLPTVLGDRAQLGAVLQNLLATRLATARRPAARGAHRRPPRAARLADRDHRQRPRRVPGRPQPRLRAVRPCRRLPRRERHRARDLPAHRRRARWPDRIDTTVTQGARFWFELPD